LHVRFEADAHPQVFGQAEPFAKTLMPILRGRRRHQPLQLDDHTTAAEQLLRELARFTPDATVVRADERRILVTLHGAVEHDHRNAFAVDFRDRFGQGRGFFR
jgi:hypothetical protein